MNKELNSLTFEVASTIQVFRHDIEAFGISNNFASDSTRSLFNNLVITDLFQEYLSTNRLVVNDGGWANILSTLPSCSPKENTSLTEALQSSSSFSLQSQQVQECERRQQQRDQQLSRSLSIQQYFLQHILAWPRTLVRCFFFAEGTAKEEKEKLSFYQYRVGMIRYVTVSFVAGTTDQNQSKDRQKGCVRWSGGGIFSDGEQLANELLLPMLRFVVDFGDCEHVLNLNDVSSDIFAKEEHQSFLQLTVGRGYPLELPFDAVEEIKRRLEQCRRKVIAIEAGHKRDSNVIHASSDSSKEPFLSHKAVELLEEYVAYLSLSFNESQQDVKTEMLLNGLVDSEGKDSIIARENLERQRYLLVNAVGPYIKAREKELALLVEEEAVRVANARRDGVARMQHITALQEEKERIKTEMSLLRKKDREQNEQFEVMRAKTKKYEALMQKIAKAVEQDNRNKRVLNEIVNKMGLPSSASSDQIMEAVNNHSFELY